VSRCRPRREKRQLKLTHRVTWTSMLRYLKAGALQAQKARCPASRNMYELFISSVAVALPDVVRLWGQMKQTRAVVGGESVRLLPAEAARSTYQNQTAGSSARAFPTGPSSETLARSLMENIQEAKRLRQEEAEGRLSAYDYHDPATHVQSIKRVQELCQRHVKPQPIERPSAAQSSVPVPASASPAPIPHPKPVMPVIPHLPSLSPAETLDAVGKATEMDAAQPTTEKSSSIDDVIVAANAVLAMQRAWRRKRLVGRSTEHCASAERVTIAVDQSCASVTPLFAAASRRVQQLAAQPKLEVDVPTLGGACAAASPTREDEAAHDGKPFVSDTCYDPWTDHELVFLEEGRCVGELHESVRRGVLMDDDELVWKRPQHVIQQLETQRVATIRKRRSTRSLGRQSKHSVMLITDAKTDAGLTPSVGDASTRGNPFPRSSKGNFARRKRKLRRPRPLKYRGVDTRGRTSCKAKGLLVCAQRGAQARGGNSIADGGSGDEETLKDVAAETQDTSRSVQEANRSPSHDEEPSDEPIRGAGDAVVLDHFVVFTDSGGGLDAKHSRNDLITVGDLALARSLLRDDRHSRAGKDVAAHYRDFIPLILSSPSCRAAQTGDLKHEATPANRKELGASACPSGSARADFNGLEALERFSQEALPVDDKPAPHHSVWPWEDLSLELECKSARDQDAVPSSYSPIPCSGSNSSSAKSEAYSSACEPTQDASSTYAMKSSVAETMARINIEYREDAEHNNELAVSSQENEECSPQSPVAAIPAIRARLDQDQRMEFLRVLGDFKRCLQPLSSCSSSTCSLPSAAPKRQWKASNQADTLTVGKKGNLEMPFFA